MILVDTSVIVAWLDPTHEHHTACRNALHDWAAVDALAVNSITYAELAAGARTREGVDEDLAGFRRIEMDFDSAWRAGVAFRQYRPKGGEEAPVLPDFFIRAQAAVHSFRHLTNDRRRRQLWPEGDWVFPEDPVPKRG